MGNKCLPRWNQFEWLAARVGRIPEPRQMIPVYANTEGLRGLEPSFLEPPQDALCSAHAGGEAGLQQVAAGRRFPIEHFAGDEHAGLAVKHEAIVDFGEANAARGRDGSIDRGGAVEPQRQGVDQARQRGGIERGEPAEAGLMQKSDGEG